MKGERSVRTASIMPKNNDFALKIQKISNYLSFNRIKDMVEKLIDKEYQYGMLDEPPEIIIDCALGETSDTKQACVTIWDAASEKCQKVPYVETQGYLKRLKLSTGYTKTAVLLPNISPFGTLAVTRMVSLHKRLEDVKENELPAIFSKNLNIDLENTNSDIGYVVCEAGKDKTSYMVSAVPEDGRNQLQTSIVFGDLLGSEFTAVRVMDRVIPLSNHMLSRIDSIGECKMFLCIEQHGDNLFIWNLYRLDNGVFVPVGSETKKIPKVEAHDALVTTINLLEHELVRIKNFVSPERAIILSDKQPMLDGMFTIEELQSVCQDVLDIEDPTERDITVLYEEDAAITGCLDMEDIIAKHRDDIAEKSGL